jgi:predicted secreted protein
MAKMKESGNLDIPLVGDGPTEEEFDIEEYASNGNPKGKYAPELKMRVVLDSLRADRTQVSVSKEHNVSQPLISIWKRRALQAMMTALAADYRREGRRNSMTDKIISNKGAGHSVNVSSELMSLKSTIFRLASVLESAELGQTD